MSTPQSTPREPSTANPSEGPIQILVRLNQLSVKAFNAENAQALHFILLNDTVTLLFYDRAFLWDFNQKKIIAVSGQTTFTTSSEFKHKWEKIIKNFKKPEVMQVVDERGLDGGSEELIYLKSNHPHFSAFWCPISYKEKPVLGLWLERWNGQWTQADVQVLSLLAPAYGAAWGRFKSGVFLSRLKSKPVLYSSLAALLACSLLLRVSLRIVAPCEIVPKDPILVTAPIEGIIAEVNVNPGQMVKPGDVLFEYDKRVPLQQLKVAQKQMQVAQSELNRSNALSFQDPRSLSDAAILTSKLNKAKAELGLAEYYASRLTMKSQVSGVVVIDHPEEWRGKPVKTGEKILIISDPNQTKVRIWIPESDNVIIDLSIPITIFLNINPDISRQAQLEFISNSSTISEKQVPSFMAEAKWIGEQEDIKLGLKGTAILYGEKVSLFYYLFRKPWAWIRSFLEF